MGTGDGLTITLEEKRPSRMRLTEMKPGTMFRIQHCAPAFLMCKDRRYVDLTDFSIRQVPEYDRSEGVILEQVGEWRVRECVNG